MIDAEIGTVQRLRGPHGQLGVLENQRERRKLVGRQRRGRVLRSAYAQARKVIALDGRLLAVLAWRTIHDMSSDTKAIIGTIVAVAVSLGGLLSVQFSGINTRFDDVNARIDDLRADVTTRIDDLRTDLTTRIEAVEMNLTGVRTDLRRFDDRLRAVEIAFGKVDQRLETLERLHLPGPDPGE